MNSGKIFIANWKMNKNFNESLEFIKKLKLINNKIKDKQIIICPSYICIHEIVTELLNTNIKIGAQNCFWENTGNYTGEISPNMLKSIGVNYVLLGHSERKKHFQENNNIINKKIRACLENNLKIILCIGEQTKNINPNINLTEIFSQLQECLYNINLEHIKNNFIIAYEPVWAIGTGLSMNPLEANNICENIRDFFNKKYNYPDINILYGGSINNTNSHEFLIQKNINGVLIGNASLDLTKFIEILN